MHIHFCATHESRLRKKIGEFGLAQYIACSPEDFEAKAEVDPTGWTRRVFDPLMLAYSTIVELMVQEAGPMSGCPLCHVPEKRNRNRVVNVAAAAVFDRATQLGLLKGCIIPCS